MGWYTVMNIEIGKTYNNKTWRFLVRAIKGHGTTFTYKFNNHIYKLAYGISDKALEGAKILEGKRPIFFLCDSLAMRARFLDTLEWLREQEYYITDYQVDIDAPTPRKHMIVLEIPKEFACSYDNFCLGLYSKMYTKSQLDELFADKNSQEYKVLSKSSDYSQTFLDIINKDFGVTFEGKEKDEFLEDAELEYPINYSQTEEIFNY